MKVTFAVSWPLPVGIAVLALSALNDPAEFVLPPPDSVKRMKSSVPLPEPTMCGAIATMFELVISAARLTGAGATLATAHAKTMAHANRRRGVRPELWNTFSPRCGGADDSVPPCWSGIYLALE